MRVTLEIDDALIKDALTVSGLKTETEVVHEALRQYVASLRRKKLLLLAERDTWEGDLDQMRGV